MECVDKYLVIAHLSESEWSWSPLFLYIAIICIVKICLSQWPVSLFSLSWSPLFLYIAIICIVKICLSPWPVLLVSLSWSPLVSLYCHNLHCENLSFSVTSPTPLVSLSWFLVSLYCHNLHRQNLSFSMTSPTGFSWLLSSVYKSFRHQLFDWKSEVDSGKTPICKWMENPGNSHWARTSPRTWK